MKTVRTTTRTTIGLLAVSATLAATAVTLTAGVAQADPPAGSPQRPIVGVGSDTTDPVMNGLAEAITVGGSKPLASYDALGPTFSSRSSTPAGNTEGCTYLDNRTSQPQGSILRPNGSGAGRTALVNSLTAGNPRFGCLDYARSSSISLAATGAGRRITYVPFALDGLTYAVRGDSTIPRDLTKADLVAIYTCQNPNIVPLIPQVGSGTRGSWASYVGLTEAQVVSSACIKDAVTDPATGSPLSVQEHDGRALVAKNMIAPFSASQWSAQSVGAISDRRFGAVLGGIEGVPALSVNANSAAGTTRTVYNIIPFSRIGGTSEADQLLNQVFVGSGSQICSNPGVISRYGLATVPNCGATTQTTPES